MKLYPNLIYFLLYNFILFTLRQPAKHVFYKAKGKVKVKFALEQATKAQWGSTVIAVLFNLSVRKKK
jgi:hypothetical protein